MLPKKFKAKLRRKTAAGSVDLASIVTLVFLSLTLVLGISVITDKYPNFDIFKRADVGMNRTNTGANNNASLYSTGWGSDTANQSTSTKTDIQEAQEEKAAARSESSPAQTQTTPQYSTGWGSDDTSSNQSSATTPQARTAITSYPESGQPGLSSSTTATPPSFKPNTIAWTPSEAEKNAPGAPAYFKGTVIDGKTYPFVSGMIPVKGANGVEYIPLNIPETINAYNNYVKWENEQLKTGLITVPQGENETKALLTKLGKDCANTDSACLGEAFDYDLLINQHIISLAARQSLVNSYKQVIELGPKETKIATVQDEAIDTIDKNVNPEDYLKNPGLDKAVIDQAKVIYQQQVRATRYANPQIPDSQLAVETCGMGSGSLECKRNFTRESYIADLPSEQKKQSRKLYQDNLLLLSEKSEVNTESLENVPQAPLIVIDKQPGDVSIEKIKVPGKPFYFEFVDTVKNQTSEVITSLLGVLEPIDSILGNLPVVGYKRIADPVNLTFLVANMASNLTGPTTGITTLRTMASVFDLTDLTSLGVNMTMDAVDRVSNTWNNVSSFLPGKPATSNTTSPSPIAPESPKTESQPTVNQPVVNNQLITKQESSSDVITPVTQPIPEQSAQTFYSQTSPEWQDFKISTRNIDAQGNITKEIKTMAQIGCGPTTVANILNENGIKATPVEIVQQIQSNSYGWGFGSGGTSFQLNIDILKKNGYSADPYTKSLYNLTKYMKPNEKLWISAKVNNNIEHHTYIDSYTIENGKPVFTMRDPYFGTDLKCSVASGSIFGCSGSKGQFSYNVENQAVIILTPPSI